MTFYAFEYSSGPRTTSGEPNPNTGRVSIAGFLVSFQSRRDRDLWVADGEFTYNMGGRRDRVAVTAKITQEQLLNTVRLGGLVVGYLEMRVISVWE